MKELHELLKELREDHDFTQQHIANYLSIYREQYFKYESGKQELPIRHLRKLCMLYGVSADYVLGLPKGLKYRE